MPCGSDWVSNALVGAWGKNPASTPTADWHEGAGGLILLAAAHETGLIATLGAGLPQQSQAAPLRLVKSKPVTRRQRLQTSPQCISHAA